MRDFNASVQANKMKKENIQEQSIIAIILQTNKVKLKIAQTQQTFFSRKKPLIHQIK
jgi:hypothetical protein